MKMEDEIRQHHELADRLRALRTAAQQYVDDCLTMDLRTMEIGMARIFDLMNQSATEAERLDRMFKGRLLKDAYDKKQAGARATWLNRIGGRCTIEELIDYTFNYPAPLTEQFVIGWGGVNNS